MDWSTIDFSVFVTEVTSIAGEVMPSFLQILAMMFAIGFVIMIFKWMIGMRH
jgi:hypothetical protein